MKGNKIVILCLAILICFNTNIISQSYFSKVIDAVNGNEKGIQLLNKEGKYFVFGKGVIWDYSNQTYTTPDFLQLLDGDLNSITKVIIDDNFATAVVSVCNDTIYWFGMNAKSIPYTWEIKKFDLNGDSIDMISVNHFINEKMISEDIVINDSHIYLVGRSFENSEGGADIVVIKLSKSGEVLLENRFFEIVPPSDINLAENIIETSDGNFVISVYRQGDFNEDRHHFNALIKFDENLDAIWAKYYSITSSFGGDSYWYYPRITPTREGGIVVGAAINITDSIYLSDSDKYEGYGRFPLVFSKFDINGNLSWTDTLYSFLVPDYPIAPVRVITKLLTTKNDDILGVGIYEDNTKDPYSWAWIFKYSSEGELLWEHIYTDPAFPGNSFLFDVKEGENEDIICIGGIQTDGSNPNNSNFTWLLRLDKNGCITPGCPSDSLTEIITKIENVKPLKNELKIGLSPNPVINEILVTKDASNALDFIIYDCDGNQVDSFKGSIGVNTIRRDVSQLNTGIYILQSLSKTNNAAIVKFIKLQ